MPPVAVCTSERPQQPTPQHVLCCCCCAQVLLQRSCDSMPGSVSLARRMRYVGHEAFQNNCPSTAPGGPDYARWVLPNRARIPGNIGRKTPIYQFQGQFVPAISDQLRPTGQMSTPIYQIQVDLDKIGQNPGPNQSRPARSKPQSLERSGHFGKSLKRDESSTFALCAWGPRLEGGGQLGRSTQAVTPMFNCSLGQRGFVN